jgi:protein tyrosine/serine phosphatase
MKNLNRRRILIAGVLLFAVAGSTLAQGKVRYAELPNFHLVNSQLYRGAQPKIGGLQTLKTMGIKAIVNLRGKDEQTGSEGQEARALGLRYYNISLPGFSEPKDKEVRQVLDIINNLENQPVFVHCHHGEDRTGTIIACYRITHDGWTAAEAKKEAEKLGMSWTQFGMKRYIDEFYRPRPIPAEQRRIGGRRPYGT